ncbi:hypothetical protein EV421DRAFT_1902185 [Armillaria borealis]|uniref:RING-type domain-containing protein n=1 Tax=Armillaria borealis TaxID=47425 RepID=A0AA39MTU9_9AGAR|nr:hypothetical protein EV421DRAFT_1902185 [Armillaria borealis]
MSSSTPAASLNDDQTLELQLLRECVGGLLQTVDGLEDALLAQTEHAQTARAHAEHEWERAENQAIKRAKIAQNDKAWWRNVYYQENYKLCMQVADLEEEQLYLKGALRDPRSVQAAADHEGRRVRRDQVFEHLRCDFCQCPMTDACLLDCGHTFHTPCLLERYQAFNFEFRTDQPHEGTAPFKCPVCLEHATVYLPDLSTGRNADFWPRVEGAWAQLFPECSIVSKSLGGFDTAVYTCPSITKETLLRAAGAYTLPRRNGPIMECSCAANDLVAPVETVKHAYSLNPHNPPHLHPTIHPLALSPGEGMSHTMSELDLLRIQAGELLEEVNDLKDELKQAKERVEAGQNEAEWWQVRHYQEQYHTRQQVHDLEDEINTLREENIQAGRHSREGVAERRENRQRRDQIFDVIRCFMCETLATEACI